MTVNSHLPARLSAPRTALASPRVPRRGETARLATRVAVVILAGVVVVALVVRAALGPQARGWLGYSFRGVPARLDVAAGIFAHNGTALLGVFGLLLIAQLTARGPRDPDVALRIIRTGGELILGGVIAANTLVVGAALGAYGERMARAVLPHGPVELAAYALALALYVQGRRRALPAGHLATVAGASVALLALAAVLETFVNV